MSLKPGDPYVKEFTTANPTTGAAADADTTPVATPNHNGTDDGATFTLTVTHIDTGRYKITGTIPVGYAAGDIINVTVAATCSSIAGKAPVDCFVLDSKRVGDLHDAAVLTDYQQRAVAVTLPANPPSGFLVTASYSTAPAWYTAQTGDSFARIGANGAGLTAVVAASVTAPVTVNFAQTGITFRALDAVADASLTLGDGLMAAICAAAGKETVVGTTYTIKSPSTGTVIRSFVLDQNSNPTSRS